MQLREPQPEQEGGRDVGAVGGVGESTQIVCLHATVCNGERVGVLGLPHSWKWCRSSSRAQTTCIRLMYWPYRNLARSESEERRVAVVVSRRKKRAGSPGRRWITKLAGSPTETTEAAKATRGGVNGSHILATFRRVPFVCSVRSRLG